MSEKDLNKKISDADLENVSGGVIEQGTGTFGKKLYRTKVKDETGVWRLTQKLAKNDEDALILKQYAANNSDYHQLS